MCYNGASLARNHDVVVVTHNHRVNLFGYLNLADIGGDQYASSGNAGMLDIVAVLEWVRDNIAAFGGDPGNVLIYGQSGGGGKVSHLMAMPAAKGLFHRAVVQSGSALRSGSAAAAAEKAAAILQELQISRNSLDKLRSLPASDLQRVQPIVERRLAAAVGRGSGLGGWGPIVDERSVPSHPFDPGAPAVSAGVPMLIGTCLNEMVNGTDNPERETLNDDELIKRVSARYRESAADIVAAYRKEYPKETPSEYGPRSRLQICDRMQSRRRNAKPPRAALPLTCTSTPGARPRLGEKSVRFTAAKSLSFSIMPPCVLITRGTRRTLWPFLRRWARRGRLSRGRAGQVTAGCPHGRHSLPRTVQR